MIEPSKSAYDFAREFQSRINCSMFADDMTALAEMVDRDRNLAADSLYPIFDILERLLSTGHEIKKQDDRWHLFRADGEGLMSGATFRELCVNIVLAGL